MGKPHFLKSSWINSAPTLYAKAIQKNTIVDKALTRNKWVDRITPIHTQPK